MKTENTNDNPITALIAVLQKLDEVVTTAQGEQDDRPTFHFDPFEHYAKQALRDKSDISVQAKALRRSVNTVMEAIGEADSQERIKVSVKSIKGAEVYKVSEAFVSSEGILFLGTSRNEIFPIVELGKLGDKAYLYPNKLVAVDSGKTGKTWVAVIK